jgi:hypothetical protein
MVYWPALLSPIFLQRSFTAATTLRNVTDAVTIF